MSVQAGAPQQHRSEPSAGSESLHAAGLITFEATISNAERERIRAAVFELSALSPAKSLAALTFDWVVIGAAIAIGTGIDSLLAAATCIFIIGSRQHGLLLLMHEAAHRRLHPNARFNEWLSDLFCAFPLFVTTASYRSSHFAHHRHTNTDLDPDWIPRKGHQEWRFPKSRLQMSVLLLKQLSGLNVGGMAGKALRFGQTEADGPARASPGPAHDSSSLNRTTSRVVFYACTVATLTYFGVWMQFLLFWMLPIVTSLALLMRVRSISEHFGLSYADELSCSRNVIPAALERPFLGLHSSHLHLDHHLYPSVPFYNLRSLHQQLLNNDIYRRSAKKNTSYILRPGCSLWNDLVRPPITG